MLESEETDTIHLVASFNSWLPIKLNKEFSLKKEDKNLPDFHRQTIKDTSRLVKNLWEDIFAGGFKQLKNDQPSNMSSSLTNSTE